ncbi:MAG: SPASM domain-containing protein, partial [Pseudobdellovibrio sp.]
MKNKVFHTPEEISQLFETHNLPKNFCIVPFTNMIFNPGGKVSVCRQKGTDHTIGHLDQNSANEIWNNNYIQQWRNEFLTGDVKICAKEQGRDACHLSSSNYHFFSDVKLTTRQDTHPLKITANL